MENVIVPMFSIVVPVYNTVKELPRCVNSVLEQTFQNFELILVDDGSKDGSGQLCDELAEKDSRIVCIHKENGGASEARNTGVRFAKGTYLMFLDSDDMWNEKNALAEINQIINENVSLDVICFGVEILDEDGTKVKIRKPELPEDIKNNKKDILKHLVYTNQYFSASYVKVVRRQFFIHHNLYFIKGLVSGEDIEWSARVMVLCKSINVYSSTFYKRIRRISGSITSEIKDKNVLDVLEAIEKGVQYAKENAENQDVLNLYLEYWAYQYAMLFGLAGKLNTSSKYNDIVLQLKKYKWLLKYNHVKKVFLVGILCFLVGVNNTIKLLALYYGCKK